MEQQHSLWKHLPLLLQSSSFESVEYILQALWRTRRTGLDDTDRKIIREMLGLSSDSDLDPLLVCLRILMRKCVDDNICKDEIHKLFPEEVLPELKKCLTLILQKFQLEWRQDVHKEMVSLPRLKAMTWNLAGQNVDAADPIAVINLKLKDDTRSLSGETEVKFQLSKDTLGAMVKSLYLMRDQLINAVVSLPRLKAMTWNLANQNVDAADRIAVINLKLKDDTRSLSGETEVKFQLSKDTLGAMVKSLYLMRDQLINAVDDASNEHQQPLQAGGA